MTHMTGYVILAIEPLMPALVPGIHVFLSFKRQDVDGRNKSGHDE
jgi:hypothetical protein